MPRTTTPLLAAMMKGSGPADFGAEPAAEVAKDPYMASPTTSLHLPSMGAAKRTRSRSVSRRTPVKEQGRKPQAKPPTGPTLGEKLAEARNSQVIDADADIDEDELVANLGQAEVADSVMGRDLPVSCYECWCGSHWHLMAHCYVGDVRPLGMDNEEAVLPLRSMVVWSMVYWQLGDLVLSAAGPWMPSALEKAICCTEKGRRNTWTHWHIDVLDSRPSTAADFYQHMFILMDLNRYHDLIQVRYLYKKRSETLSVDVAYEFPMSMEQVYDVARDSRNAMAQTWLKYVVPIQPQLHDDYGSLMLLPDWVIHSDKCGVLLDARDANKEIFAYYHTGPLTRYSVLQHAEFPQTAPVEVFVGGDLAPLGPAESRRPSQGILVKIMPRGMTPVWSGVLEDRLRDPDQWNPHQEHPLPADVKLIAFQTEQEQHLHRAVRGTEDTQSTVVVREFDKVAGSFWLRAPTDRPRRLNWCGLRVHTIVAVADTAEHPRPGTQIVFVDLRGIGVWPQWVAVQNHRFNPGRYVEALQIEVVEGYTVVVYGGRQVGREGDLHVEYGDTVEVALRCVVDLSKFKSHALEGKLARGTVRRGQGYGTTGAGVRYDRGGGTVRPG
ncbi:unnamed protein product, partial [Symbiodinium sp. CCMP2592]